MDKVIIYKNDNGGVSVCIPTGELTVEEVQAKDVPSGKESYVVSVSALPSGDGDFFDAWELSGSTVLVNLSKARELTKQRLRFERAPLLYALDIEFQRALERGEDTSDIVAKKDKLRAVTDLVEQCTTTSQLRNLKAT